MAWALPRLLRRLRPALSHFQHALPLARRAAAVLTLHDLHFERDPRVMGPLDRIIFKLVVPRSRAARRPRARGLGADARGRARAVLDPARPDHGDAAWRRPRIHPRPR